jgi:hypothetical protein
MALFFVNNNVGQNRKAMKNKRQKIQFGSIPANVGFPKANQK